MRIEPSPSEAWAIGSIPAPTADAAPPDEPPDMRVGSQGLRHGPSRRDSVVPVMPYSGVFVLPNSTIPVARKRFTSSLSWSSTIFATNLLPLVRGQPFTSVPRSLMRKGTPLKGPSGSLPFAASRASSKAE